MAETVAAIEKMIAEAEGWRLFHKQRLAHIEAAACSIRLKALRDALGAFPRPSKVEE